MEFWNSHSSAPISEADWPAVWRSTSRNKIYPTLSQTKFWLFHKAFWTPARLHAQNIRDEPTCWNCNEDIGDVPHLLFHCKCVTPFWDAVFNFITDLFSCTPAREFSTLVFGFLKANLKNDKDRALFDLLLTVAIKIILYNWKDSRKANYKAWLNWVSNLRGADNISLQNSPWKSPLRQMWDTLDLYFDAHKPS